VFVYVNTTILNIIKYKEIFVCVLLLPLLGTIHTVQRVITKG